MDIYGLVVYLDYSLFDPKRKTHTTDSDPSEVCYSASVFKYKLILRMCTPLG